MTLSPEAKKQLTLFKIKDGQRIGYHNEGCEPFILGGGVRLDQRELLADRPLFIHHSLDGQWTGTRAYEIAFTVTEEETWYTSSSAEWNALFDPAEVPGRGMPATKKLQALAKKGYRLFIFLDQKAGEDEALLFPAPEVVSAVTLVTTDHSSNEFISNEVECLIEVIQQAQIDYHDKDQPTMSDAQYDQFVHLGREYLTSDHLSPSLRKRLKDVIERVGAKPTRGLYPVKHREPMLSLDNVFTVAELQEWLDTWGGAETNVSFKYDGLAVTITYLNQQLCEAATRGDRFEGESILHNVKGFDSIPKSLPKYAPNHVEVRGELIMFNDEFERYNQRLVERGLKLAINPRNAAAGIARRLNSDKLPGAQLVFIPYGVYVSHEHRLDKHDQSLAVLTAWGFDLTWSWIAPRFTYHTDRPLELLEYLEARQKERTSLPFGVDGLVFRVNDYAVCDRLGSTSRAPRWAVAYKFPAEEKFSVVRDIRLQIGRTGNATPVAVLEPVAVGGVTVTSVTLHNEDQINRLGLAIGDTVVVRRAGDVIPEIVSVVTRPTNRIIWKFPTHCECGATIERPKGYANHICTAGVHCDFQQQRTLEHFVSRDAFDIEGVGPELIADLIQARKLVSFHDFFYLTKEDILAVTSETSDKLAENVIKAIEKSRKTTLARFIYGLGIPMVGHTTAKRLADWFGNLELVVKASPVLLKAVPDIGPTVAEWIGRYFSQDLSWNSLLLAGVEITDEMGPCPDFAKYADFDELLLLANIKGVTRKRIPQVRQLLDRLGYPGYRAVIFKIDDPEVAKAKEFQRAHAKALYDVERDWSLVKDHLKFVRQIHNNQPLAGSTYVITGGFDETLGSRQKITSELEALGAKVVGSVSKHTTAVFVGDSPGTNKLDKAKELNVPTLFVHDLRELLAKHSQ